MNEKALNTIKPPKKKQGKIDRELVFKLYTEGKTTKKDIAVKAGSLAQDDNSLINSANHVINSNEFQLRLEDHRKNQRMRALKRVQKAEEKIDLELMAENQSVLAQFINQNEKLLQESVKQSNDNVNEKEKIQSSSNLTVEQLKNKLKHIQENKRKLESIIEGELVKD